jgi:hypothetical protein
VLIQDGLRTPATRAVKFTNDVGFILELKLINSVFVTVQYQKATGTSALRIFDCIENVLGMQCLKLACERVISEERYDGHA